MAPEIVLHNLMEDLVSNKLDCLMQQSGMCCCDECRADVMALTLNNLPPRYVATISGDVFTRFDTTKPQAQADITAKIIWAISIIQSNPRHEMAE